jgi:hypothetical protein
MRDMRVAPSFFFLLATVGCGSDEPEGESLCAFFDDPNNCFEQIVAEAQSCIDGAFQMPGTWSSDRLLCTSEDGAVTTKFASDVLVESPSYDVTVERGGALCFRYVGPGSGGTPATFASASHKLEMDSQSKFTIRCDGRLFSGSIMTSCSGTKYFPSVGTSAGDVSASMEVGTTRVYSCRTP